MMRWMRSLRQYAARSRLARHSNTQLLKDRCGMIWNRTWREEALAVGLAALMTVVLLTLAYHRVWPLSIPVGENDSRFAVDFNAPESIGGRVVRWTNGASRVLVPRPPDGTPAVLS